MNIATSATPANGVAVAQLFSSPAPWVSGAFAPIDRTFFSLALPHLSARAVRIYMAHLAVASQSTGNSQCYRDTLAAAANCSTDTVDRGNDELEHYGIIVAQGSLFRCGGPIVYVLTPSKQWTFKVPFARRKSAEPVQQKCPARAARVRNNTKRKKTEKVKQNNKSVVVESTSSPVEASTEVPQYSQEQIAEWTALLIGARLSKESIPHYLSPDVPRVVKWWATVDKTRYGLGLLISRLKDPSKLPVEEKPVPTVENNAARDDWQAERPQLSIEEKRARATAHIAACLALLEPQRRASYAKGLEGFALTSQRAQYLQRSLPCEWEEAGRALDKNGGFQRLH